MNDSTETQASEEVQVVDAQDVKVYVEEYDPLKAMLTERRKTLEAKMPDVNDSEGYDLIAQEVKETKRIMAIIEVTRKTARAKWKPYGQAIQDQAADYTLRLQKLIDPWIADKKEVDDVEKAAAAERKEAKLKRIAIIKDRIQFIVDSVTEATGKNSTEVRAVIDELTLIDVEDRSFEEFTDEAITTKQISLERLEELFDKAVTFEKSQEEAKAAREKLVKDQAEFDAKKKADDDAEDERQATRDKEDADRKATQKKEDDERDARIKADDDKRERKQKIINRIVGMKEELTRILQCDNVKEMGHVIAYHKQIDLTVEIYGDQLEEAKEEHTIVWNKLVKIYDNKIEAEQKQMAIDEENRKIRVADQKRINEDNERERKEFEDKAEEERKAKEKAERDADVERNQTMRGEAYRFVYEAVKGPINREQLDLIFGLLSEHNVPHITCAWKVQK